MDVGSSEQTQQERLVGGKPATTEPLVTATSSHSKALLGEPFAEGAAAGELSGL